MNIVLVHWVIEEYEDGNDPPEPWGWYEHPSDQKLEIGQRITLKTLDGRDHHIVEIVSINGSELRTRPPRRCQRCNTFLIKGPTSLDEERYERGICGGC